MTFVTLTCVLDNVGRKDNMATVEVLNSNEGVSDGIVDPDDLRGPFGLDDDCMRRILLKVRLAG